MLPNKLDHYQPYLEEFSPLDQELLLVRWQRHTPQTVKDRFVADLGQVQPRTPLVTARCTEGRQCYQCACHRGLSFPWCTSTERLKSGKSREIESEAQAQACLHFSERADPAPWTGPCRQRRQTAA